MPGIGNCCTPPEPASTWAAKPSATTTSTATAMALAMRFRREIGEFMAGNRTLARRANEGPMELFPPWRVGLACDGEGVGRKVRIALQLLRLRRRKDLPGWPCQGEG